jgi:hypothetical protein
VTPRPSERSRVRIHYRRLPDSEQVFDQRVVLERDDVIVTLSAPLELDRPMEIDGRVALETGSVAVWFTFPGAWHDVGRFHRADGTFTGIYANILTPAVILTPPATGGPAAFEGPRWHTTDLFLDVWLPAGGPAMLLDEDELAAALEQGDIDPEVAARAREEAERLLDLARTGRWPPDVVRDWTLERSLAVLEEG